MNEPAPAFDPGALVAEAAKKSALLWVRVPGAREQAVWHAWHEGSAYVLVGGAGSIEQPLPGIDAAEQVDVIARSKDKGSRLVTWRASVTTVAPDGEQWAAVVPLLLGERLNLPDGEAAAGRWARECRLYRLTPVGPLVEGPGSYADGSHAAEPRPTPATTRVPRPWHLMRLRRR